MEGSKVKGPPRPAPQHPVHPCAAQAQQGSRDKPGPVPWQSMLLWDTMPYQSLLEGQEIGAENEAQQYCKGLRQEAQKARSAAGSCTQSPR